MSSEKKKGEAARLFQRAKAHGKASRDSVLKGAEARAASWSRGYKAALADVRKVALLEDGADNDIAQVGANIMNWLEDMPQ